MRVTHVLRRIAEPLQTVCMDSEHTSAFAAVRGRYIVVLWLSTWWLPFIPGFNDLVSSMGADWPWYWWETVYVWLHDGLFLAVLAFLTVVVWRLPIETCWGQSPARGEIVSGFQLTAFVFLASIAAIYLTFWPLSFAAPDIVQWWYIDRIFPLIYHDAGTYPFVPNVLSLLSLCVVAPALEEIAFRGILLPRWAHKWGLPAGALTSSALFGIVHIDPIGAFLFGLAMCIVYLRSKSLMLAIVCHGLHNLVVWFMEIGSIAIDGPEYWYTLENFQASWPWGIAAVLLTAAWSYIYLIGPKSNVRWSLPVP